jgi:CoA:oxalate CoA-transferase
LGNTSFKKPLEGIVVLDFSQFLSGPSAALRLADLGAKVIKVERTEIGDICRTLYISNLELDGDSTLFHSINRNKEGIAVDLKNEEDLNLVKTIIQKADVIIENFRPGVMERIGLDYHSVKEMNPKIIYGEITGYGSEGPWRSKPGQDLIVQSISGLCWLNGNQDQPPVPFGLSIVDMIAGAQLVQGILASLIRRNVSGTGSYVQVSLLEAILDMQFEVFTSYLNDGGQEPIRSSVNNANAYIGAPYGIYETSDGYIALAMGSIIELSKLLDCKPLSVFKDEKSWFNNRDEIKALLVEHLKTNTTKHWLSILEPVDFWCAEVLTWEALLTHDGFKVLNMVQEVYRKDGARMLTTRCPIRIDGQILTSTKGSPVLGEDHETIMKEMVFTNS